MAINKNRITNVVIDLPLSSERINPLFLLQRVIANLILNDVNTNLLLYMHTYMKNSMLSVVLEVYKRQSYADTLFSTSDIVSSA